MTLAVERKHQAWSDLVYSHRMRGREIVDALWSSDTPFADLRKQLKDPMPMELREAALQVLGPRMHSLIDDANALFERGKISICRAKGGNAFRNFSVLLG